MAGIERIRVLLEAIDGKDYGALQALCGRYEFPDFVLGIDRIPKDPYAPPHTGVYRLFIAADYLDVPPALTTGPTREVAYRDLLARQFFAASAPWRARTRGTGNSGIITVEPPGQAILERNSVLLTAGGVEVRCFVGLPAEGRRVNASLAATMLTEELPDIVRRAYAELDRDVVRTHVEAAEDAATLRAALADRGLVAFIADGSVLPRATGESDEPLTGDVVRFHSPEGLAEHFTLPHAGGVRGMGIPRGVTLIVGGGFHGKSTLLRAIETGIYDHVPGDGRELCVTSPLATKVRAFSGRSVRAVDISWFVGQLPSGAATTTFSSANASGSTSQAASIVEAIDAGADALLMDEDTCAANLMYRDDRMQRLVHPEDEPISPYTIRARQLHDQLGVSSVIAVGGTGDYFAVADTVIQMREYLPVEVTSRAHEIARSDAHVGSADTVEATLAELPDRLIEPASIDPANRYGKRSASARERHRVSFGATTIDLTDVEQLVELGQTKTIVEAVLALSASDRREVELNEACARIDEIIEREGLDGIAGRRSGDLARVRTIELAMALNRLSTLGVRQRSRRRRAP